MSTTQCANTRGSPEKNLTPWNLSPSFQTFTRQAVTKETVRSPSLYWGLPRPAWWPTDSLSNSLRIFCMWGNRLGIQADELYLAMLEVGHAARCHRIPGPLAHTMIDVAQKSLETWRRDEKMAVPFASGVLTGPTNLQATSGHSFLSLWLPHVGGLSGCWNTSQISMEVDRKLSARLAGINYSPRG